MKLSDLSPGDVVCSTDAHGTAFYRVEKVCARIVKVRTEQGDAIRLHPQTFDRKLSASAVAGLRAEGTNI